MSKTQGAKIAVLFMGKPGAGKGTQADALVEKLGLVHFNTGEVIRHRIARPKTDEDKREKANYESGKLCTFEWVAKLVVESAHDHATKGQGLVFSGSPRSLFEAEQLLPLLLEDYGKDNVIGIFLDIDDQHAVARNGSRLTCNFCGNTLNALQSDKQEGDLCSKCGGKLIKRVIDTEEKIRGERLPEYYKNTVPVIEYLRNLGILHELDGRGSIDGVTEKVWGIIGAVAAH